ncbi:MAG: exodeoxyribonuclease III, partial [Nakamurella sp.]
MRLATWNVNSIRARVDRLVEFLRRSDVDVIAIQETKVTDPGFPAEAVAALGYRVAHHGLNQWNGVAVLSRVGLDDVQVGFPGLPMFGEPLVTEARAVSAVCAGVRVWSIYVPNG